MLRGQSATLGKCQSCVVATTNQPKQLHDLIDPDHTVALCQLTISLNLRRHSRIHTQSLGSEFVMVFSHAFGTLLVQRSHRLQHRQGDYCADLCSIHWAGQSICVDGAQVSATESDRPGLLRRDVHRAILSSLWHQQRSSLDIALLGRSIMAAASDDRRTAFETEALPHLDAVYRLALRLAGDEAQADDLVQETMLKAYRSWHQYKSGTNVRAWLLTILRHTFINEYRKAKRAGPTVDIGEIEGYYVFHEVQEVDPEGEFFRQIVDDEVLRAIDSLPDEFRETLVLSDVEQLTYAEIAEVTGVPVGTVKSRLFRARQALQQRLYDYALEMGYIKGVER